MVGLNGTYPKGHGSMVAGCAVGTGTRGGMVPYWRLFYHVVQATRGRQPFLSPRHEEMIKETIRTVCRERGVIVHAVGLVPDHVHVAASIPPAHAISEIVGQWKGATSYQLRRDGGFGDDAFAWQKEYGVHSFGERALADVLSYVRNQPERHRLGRLWTTLERINDRDNSSIVPEGPPASRTTEGTSTANERTSRPSRALKRPSNGKPGH